MSAVTAPAALHRPEAPVDATAFRHVLGRFASGVTFVTASVDGEPLGLVVSAFTSVSLDPPLVAFSPSRASLTWQRMRAARRYAVNVLAEAQAPFVRQAAPAGADRFGGIAHHPDAGGAPLLAGTAAHLSCDVEAEHPAGDHWIVICRVRALSAAPERPPLVTCDRALGGFAAAA